MLAASFCREVHFTVLTSSAMASCVPRCLFGQPNPKDTVELLQDALDMERNRFSKRWGVDPCSEDKENIYHRKLERSPRKRGSPYARQTNIHDYWRARKCCDHNKKTSSVISSSGEVMKQQNQDPSKKSTSNLKNSCE